MIDREKIISAIEKAKKQSEEYAQDRIIVPFKEADMIIALLKEQEAKEQISDAIHETAKLFRQTIVRCKDCKYWEDAENCSVYDLERPEDWFCADGVAKDKDVLNK